MRLSKKHLTNRQRSKRSEKRCADIFKGRIQPASGSLPPAAFKGDVKSELFLIDDKNTNLQSFGVKSSVFKKLRREAFMNDKKPMIRIEFQDITLCVLEQSDLLALIK